MSELPRWAYAINRLMLEKGATRKDLEVGTGLSGATLTNILNGQTKGPQADTLLAIANVLMVDLVEVFCTEQQAQALRSFPIELDTLRQQIVTLVKRIEILEDDRKSRAVEPPTSPSGARTRHSDAHREKASEHARKDSRLQKRSTTS